MAASTSAMGSSSCRSRKTASSRRRFALAALAAATAGAGVSQAQDLTGNLTSLTGTWSSGTGAVLTGPVSLGFPARGHCPGECSGLEGMRQARTTTKMGSGHGYHRSTTSERPGNAKATAILRSPWLSADDRMIPTLQWKASQDRQAEEDAFSSRTMSNAVAPYSNHCLFARSGCRAARIMRYFKHSPIRT